MPDFTIRGNPGAIRSKAQTMRSKSELFTQTGDGLAKITTGGWVSRSADRFKDKFDTEPGRWRDAGSDWRTAASALEDFADALTDAQRRAAAAEKEHARGDQVTQDAKHAYDADVSRAKGEAARDRAAGMTVDLTIVPFHDPGEAVRQGALSDLASAKSDLDGAAHTCASGVRAGCAHAPKKRNWLEKAGGAIGSFFSGAGEALLDIGKLAAFLTMPEIVIPMMLMNDMSKGMTAEEIAAKYKLKLDDAGNMLKFAVDHPAEFGKTLGKAVLDWDTWKDDPARALGHLLPDAVIAVLTLGSGTAATRGAKGLTDGMKGLESLSKMDDLSRLRHLDDVGDVGKLDDLSDLGKIDGAGDPASRLSDAERAGLDLYTGYGYDHINSHLRGIPNQLGHDVFPPAELSKYSDDVSSALSKMPLHPGDTMRGTNLPQSVLDHIDSTKTFKDSAFMSSSTDAQVAQGFRADGNAMLHINAEHGRDVSSLSQFTNEAEVLFDKGTPFDVLKKTWNDDGYWDIYLKEGS